MSKHFQGATNKIKKKVVARFSIKIALSILNRKIKIAIGTTVGSYL